jgi:hypothetical protein
MKTLHDYLSETETWIDQPRVGDEFDIELAPDELIETRVIEVLEDGIVLDANDGILALLEQRGHQLEDIKRYGAVGSSPGMGYAMNEQDTVEGAVKDLDIELQDYMSMTPQQFLAAYGVKKADWAMDHHDLLQKNKLQVDWTGKTGFDYVQETNEYFNRIMELAGSVKRIEETAPIQPDTDANRNDPLLAKSLDDAAVGAMEEQELSEEDIDEAEYRGRKVPLGKPMRGDVKKFKVYVKDPATGNVKKVNFGHGGTSAKRAGQKTMKIKKSNPARRKSFRARHNCDNPGPRTKARYWSCRAW